MTLKIVHISDTHLRPISIVEGGDILVHSGDGMNSGDLRELPDLIKQLNDIHMNYQKIIYVPGNHDWVFQHNPTLAIEMMKNDIPNIDVLIHETMEYEGYKWFGTPWQPHFCSWAFNLRPWDLADKYKQIPDDTQILVTHCPPKGILDYVINKFNPEGCHVGSPELQHTIPRLKDLKVHMFGHIHYSRGQKLENGIEFSNGAICDERYKAVNKENIIEIEKK